MTSCDQGWSDPQQCFRINPGGCTQTYVATGTRWTSMELEQWVGCVRARRPELEMLEETESRDFRNYCLREEAFRDVLDNHRHRNRRLRVDMRSLLEAILLRSGDESVTHDGASYLGGAEVWAKVMSRDSRERQQHRDTNDTSSGTERRCHRSPAGFQKISQHFDFKDSRRPSKSQEWLRQPPKARAESDADHPRSRWSV